MKHNRRIVCSLLLLLGGILAGPHSTAGQANSIGQANSTYRAKPGLQLPSRSPAAMRIAHERYRMLRSIESMLPSFGLGHNDVSYDTLLFPLGRSDRAYVQELPGYRNGVQYYRVSCFQRKDREVKLVYQVNLKESNQPVTKRKPTSLLDYLTTNYKVKGRLSRFARSDLAIQREYVEYDFYAPIYSLQVSLFFADDTDRYYKGKFYTLDEDPYTKAKLKVNFVLLDDQFFQEYGLPVAKAELSLLK